MQVDAGKAAKTETDMKDETVRGMLPLFKLRSKNDPSAGCLLFLPCPSFPFTIFTSGYCSYRILNY